MENITANFATKEDLSEVYRKLDTKIESTRADFNKAFGDLDAKVERRFGEIEVKIEANKTEIKASANRLLWGGLGVAAAMFVGLGGLIYSNQSSMNASLDRIDRRFEHVERRFEAMDQAMERRFEAMELRLDKIDRRFEHLEQALLIPRAQVEVSPSGPVASSGN